MDKKPENTEPPKVTRDIVSDQIARGAAQRVEDQKRENRKYALGSQEAKPAMRSTTPTEQLPEIIISTPKLPSDEPKGY